MNKIPDIKQLEIEYDNLTHLVHLSWQDLELRRLQAEYEFFRIKCEIEESLKKATILTELMKLIEQRQGGGGGESKKDLSY